nr:hypothetical protein [Rhodoferax sp.]
MITKQDSPVEWAAFMYELEDAQNHLARLIADLESDSDYEATNLQVDLGHVFAHLNRAWHRRELTRDLTEEEWKAASHFPSDLEPL